MKNINSIINGVLAAAVIVLFVIFFIDDDKEETKGGSEPGLATFSQGGDAGELKIAFFNVDSVLANWDMYFQMQEELSEKQASLEAEFGGKQQAFMKRVEDAQYKIQRGLVTRAEAEQLQVQLGEEEQRLVALQNQYGLQMQEEGAVKNRQMIDKIEQFIKKFNEEYGYTYVFSYSFGGNLFYGDGANNITDLVIEGINAEYAAAESK